MPLAYHREGLDRAVLKYFGLPSEEQPDLSRWETITHAEQNPEGTVRVGIVGKYVSLLDAYKSLNEAVRHAGIANKLKVEIDWVDAEEVQEMGAHQRLAGLSDSCAWGLWAARRGWQNRSDSLRT